MITLQKAPTPGGAPAGSAVLRKLGAQTPAPQPTEAELRSQRVAAHAKELQDEEAAMLASGQGAAYYSTSKDPGHYGLYLESIYGPRAKKQGTWKHIGRQIEVQTAKVVVPVTVALAAAGSILLSPIVGTALQQAGAGIARVSGAGAARNEGLHGHEAKDKGRKLADRTRLYAGYATIIGGGIASAAGTAVSVGTTAATAMQVAGQGTQVGMNVARVLEQQQAQQLAQEHQAQQYQAQHPITVDVTQQQNPVSQVLPAPAAGSDNDKKLGLIALALGALAIAS